jgi:hypothetical protein
MRLEAQRLTDLAEKNNDWTEEIKNLLNYQWEEEAETASWRSIYGEQGLAKKELEEAVEWRMQEWRKTNKK